MNANRKRQRQIDTPMGGVMITERMWGEGSSSEHWSYIQDLEPSFADTEPTGEVLGYLVKQYAIAYHLVEEGYEYEKMVDNGKILWVRFI